MILVGDIGGSKTRLAVFEPSMARTEPVACQSVASNGHDGLESALDLFLDRHPTEVHAAVFGVAGPVVNGASRTTNLPWTIRESSLCRRLGTERVRLVNDLAAAALGLTMLRDDEFELLQTGSTSGGNQAVIAAGTGLGEALLIRHGDELITVPSEGGHVAFGPRDEVEVELWRWLRERTSRVEYESLVSGPGLVELYRFFHRDRPHADPWEDGTDGPSESISAAALAGACVACRETLGRFVSIFGAEAGNLALTGMTTGGVFVAGGIAPNILPALREGGFMHAFNDRGAFGDLMRSMPVRVVLNQQAALFGAARMASELVA